MLCVWPELLLQLADHDQGSLSNLRRLAYALGAFQPDLIANYGPLFSGQSLSMFVTYGLLHTGLSHLIINMTGLIILGRLTLEHRTSETFLTFYLLSAFGAAEMFALVGPANDTMVGASGAIFGLFGVYLIDNDLFSGVRRPLHIAPQIARVLLVTLGLILADVSSSFLLGSPVAWQAHAGGFITGAIIALIFPPYNHKVA
jgi:membrane associated rhomboid family serine protease